MIRIALATACLLYHGLGDTLNAQTLEWATPTSSAQQEIAYDVAVDQEGFVITVGTFTIPVDLDPGPGVFTVTPNGSSDIFIRKQGPSGTFIWGGSLGGNNADLGLSVAVDANNDIVLTGRVAGTLDLDIGPGVQMISTLNTTYDVLVMKLSSGGVMQWAHVFGSNNNDGGNAVAIGPGGTIVTTGVLGASGDVDPGPGTSLEGGSGLDDAFVQALDASGNFLWSATIGGPLADAGLGVDVDANGNSLVTGQFRGTVDLDPGVGVQSTASLGNSDIFILKLDGSGALVWAHGIGGTGAETASAVATGPSGEAVLTGQLTSATDMDPGPGAFVLPASFTEDAFLLKLDAGGGFTWAFLLKSFLNIGHDLAIDGQGTVVAVGTFGSTLDVDPGPDTTEFSSNGAADGYVLAYEASGAFTWGFHLGGFQNDALYGVALGPQGSVHVAGEFRASFDADPGPLVTTLTSAGGQDAFVARYGRPGCPEVLVSPRVLLDGPFDPGTQLMSDSLRVAGLIPTSEPYSALGFSPDDPLSLVPGVLTATGPDAVVDWVLLELRDPNQPSTVIASRVGLVQRDSDVVAPDGSPAVAFCDPGIPVQVAVRHRNHLGILSAASFQLTSTATSIDFTDPATPVFGTDARRDAGGIQVLWAGNTVFDDAVKYTGVQNDRDAILQAIGGIIPTSVVFGYFAEDVNMDGRVKYAGSGNDRDRVLLTIGGSIPTAVRTEQLP